MAGEEFKNVFAVADDDQIIYRWNGASYRHIQRFIAEFSAQLIQLPTNYRCPPAIVEAANRLVVYNADRTQTKQPLIAGKKNLKLPASQHIRHLEFETENDEAQGVYDEVKELGQHAWGQIAILARTRAMLERVNASLKAAHVPTVIAQRRDDFLSAEFRWFVALLKQTVRPLDKRNIGELSDAFNRAFKQTLSIDQINVDAEASGEAYLTRWFNSAKNLVIPAAEPLLQIADFLISKEKPYRDVFAAFLKECEKYQDKEDLADDIAAWREIVGEIGKTVGRNIQLDQFLQELQLRSKEPSPKNDSVRLMTIHSAKGKEFDYVFLLGLAEDILPSYQSKQKGENSDEMEEERRNCFVAITRTKECLVLSRAKSYRGWEKEPSRFLYEMGLLES